MGRPAPHPPAVLLLAAFSRHEAALRWAAGRAEAAWGPIALESPPLAFTETFYYEATMGPGLVKVFFAFERPFDPAGLPDVKLATNAWEEEFARKSGFDEARPLNLDPGYLTPAKLVLASTKDFAHRVYLRDGIYAEVTLRYRRHRWEPHEYTFPDYRRPEYHAFFDRCRDLTRRGKAGLMD
jgi:hypothetical protein